MDNRIPILPASIVGHRQRLPLIVVHASRPPNRSREGVSREGANMGLRLPMSLKNRLGPVLRSRCVHAVPRRNLRERKSATKHD
jgi:hypothetical protein